MLLATTILLALTLMWLFDRHSRLLKDMNRDLVTAFQEIAALKKQIGAK